MKGTFSSFYWSYCTLHWLKPSLSWVKEHESVSIWLSIAICHPSERRKKIGYAEFQSSFLKNTSLLYTKHSLDQVFNPKVVWNFYQMRPKLETEYILFFFTWSGLKPHSITTPTQSFFPLKSLHWTLQFFP